MTPIAVVGIDCRFPSAPDKDAFWKLLMNRTVTDSEVPAQRWDVARYFRPDAAPGSTNTRRAHFIDDVDAFDNEFFGIAPVEAAALDPQQRVLLESTWRAIEDAGTNPSDLASTPTGVFVGVMSSEWSNLQMHDYPRLTPQRATGSGYFMAANRISYHLGLTGPSMAIDTACSSSLTAIHQGCTALRSGEVDTAIAAGVNLILTPALSIFYTQAGLSAADGRCKPFGADADGIGRGEGVGTVVLRRLDDAVKAGQPIYAVVKSSVTNHDGRSNGITAPSRRSQAALMQRALALAEVDAGQIDFIEAHGTGTVLGDMIEANALGDVHGHGRREPCLLGSVKGNIGHTEGSAGIAAFIKVCLALHHRIVPPTVFGDEANAALRLDERGLRLADVPHDLPGPALGAVSSFGLGGSNAHAVLESAPVPSVPTDGRHGVLTVTAPSTEALRLNAAPLAAALDLVAPAEVAAWCDATSAVKRGRRHRLAVSGDRTALADQLRQFAAGGRDDLASSAPRSQKPAGIGLLFSGQGTQYQAMTKRLYDSNPAYRDELEATVATVQPHLEADLLTAVLGRGAAVNHTSLAQPALFAVSYALGRTLCRGGVRAAYGIGHSVGEIAAACTAGVLSLEDAAALVVARGRMMGSLATGGAMIAVDLDEEAAHRLVAGEPDCVIAAFNAPRSLTLSGAADAVARLKSSVLAHGYNAVDLPVSHAFHSPLMQPAVADFRSEIAGLKPRAARFPLFSTMLGSQIRGEEMTADYWAEQICAPVRFADAVRAALRGATVDYLAEAGPKASLLTLARKCGVSPTVATLPLCTGPGSTGGEFNDVAAILMRDGYSPDPTTWHGVAAHMQHVPSYQFDRNHRFWSESISHSSDFGTPAGDDTVSTMTHGESQQAVLAVIADVGGYPVAAMNRSSRLAEDLGYDSLLQLRLLDRLRSEYPALQSVSVADVLPHIYTIGQLVDFVLLRLREEETSR